MMSKSSTPSHELATLRERRVDLMIAISVMEDKGAATQETDLKRAALVAINAKIGALEKARVFGASE